MFRTSLSTVVGDWLSDEAMVLSAVALSATVLLQPQTLFAVAMVASYA